MTTNDRTGLLEAQTAPTKAAHDPQTPQALIDFMVRDWAEPPSSLPSLVDGASSFRARRRALSERFPGETLIVPTGTEKIRSNDTSYRFRPGSDFYYLTGNTEPDGVLVLIPQPNGGHRDVLFVEPNVGKTDARFFTDRGKGELWVGPRLGVEQSRARYGVDEARPLSEVDAILDERLRSGKDWRVRREADAAIDKRLPAQTERDAELATVLSEMRLQKDDFEVAQLEKAIAITKRAFDDVIRELPSLKTERDVEAVFYRRALSDGNDVGYGTIAAAGAHACTLHWTRNDGVLRRGELLLIDAGVETDTLYTADITRTLPIGGRFSDAQRRVYELVLEAQRAAFDACRPGNDFLAPHRAAMDVMARGLERLGVLADADEALREEHQFFRRYTLHGTSHMLGIDVHDCAEARKEAYRHGKLTPGTVLTIEPGLYFQADDLTVPAEYRGIGVRIEDNVLITTDGHRVLSADIPRDADEVQRWVGSATGSR